ncbi:MAG: 2OG-Fe(II) oxygenase [Lysobacter sp.]|nr:2OG-Fe(II) oxygenase [Lysobacter sp.]
MQDRGWGRELALGLIAQAMGDRAKADAARDGSADGALPPANAVPLSSSSNDANDAVSLPPAAATMPTPIVGDATSVDVGDRKVSVLMAMKTPQIVLFGDFLSKQECDRLVETARPRMQRSMTADRHTGVDQEDTVRTSRGMFFERGENPVVRAIEARIARLLTWPVENGENLQVLHYRPGDRYEPHHDYFDPNSLGASALLSRGGQRVATFLMYLREPERGGDTTFPELGLRFAPKRGCALYFAYDRPHPSTKTLHGGAPVIAGEKWVATKWLREGAFV